MHQRQSIRPTLARFVVPTVLAAVPVIALITIRAAGYCYPGCAIWNDSNPEWYAFLCFLCGAQNTLVWARSIL